MTSKYHPTLLAVALMGALALTTTAHAQQVPLPTTAAEVAGPAAGPQPKAYVQMMARMAYLWGWPLVYVSNQRTQLTNVPETGLLAQRGGPRLHQRNLLS